jgi:hypothetical protein
MKKRTRKKPPVNGQAEDTLPSTIPINDRVGTPDTPPEDARDAQLLREAVQNPGTVEIPEAILTTEPKLVVEIPEAVLDPNEGSTGEPLVLEPALMSIRLDRPGPLTWVEVLPKHFLRTVLLDYQPDRSGGHDYYYVAPPLQKAVRGHLKQVRIQMLFDVGNGGEAFLWAVLESDRSPYFNTLQTVLAKGPEFLRNHIILFGKVDLKAKKCDPLFDTRAADHPATILPSRPIQQLLPEALKQDHIITSPSHPVFVAMTKGRRLS